MLITMSACIGELSDAQVQEKLSEINKLQDAEEIILGKMQSRPKVFSEESLQSFPDNRPHLESVAKLQIESVEQIIALEEDQIQRLQALAALPVREDHSAYASALARIIENSVDSKRLEIERYSLLLDSSVSNRQVLESRVTRIMQRHRDVDLEGARLREEMRKIRPDRN
jgi:hypothetical protein